MKITTKLFNDRFLAGIQKNMQALLKGNEQIASGKRINKPSDDPAVMSRIMNYNNQLTFITEYKRATDTAKSYLEAMDSAFSNLNESLTRARELGLSGASDTVDQNSRIMIAKEIGVLLDGVVGIANTKVGDRYLFSGLKSNTAPIDMATGEFISDEKLFEIKISETVTINLNILASDLFSFKRVNVSDTASSILPGYNWSNNGAVTIPDADPNSALHTETGPFPDSAAPFTTVGGKLNIQVGENTAQSVGGFVINASNNKLRFDNGGVRDAVITAGVYTGAQLAAEVATRMDAVAGGDTYSVTYDANTNKFTITNKTGNASTVDIRWEDALNTTAAQIMGFNASDHTAIGIGSSNTSDTALGDVNIAPGATLNETRNAINIASAGVKAEVVNFNMTTDAADDDFRIVIASNPVSASDKIKITVDGDAELERLAYDPGGTMNMTLGTDINNYNYITETSSNNSIVVDSSNNTIAIKENGVSGTATIAEGTYTAELLEAAIKSALQNATVSGNTYTVDYNASTRKFSIASDTGNPHNLELLWADTNTTARQLLGFDEVNTAAFGAGSTDTSDNSVLANYYSFNNNYLNENNIIRALHFLKTSLEHNDSGRIVKAIDYISKTSETVSQVHAEIGARTNKLDAEITYHEDREFNITNYLSNDQDTDIAKVISEMGQKQIALEGLRTISTEFMKTNLFDFLR